MSQAIPTKPTNATKSKFSSVIPLLFVFPLLEIVQKRFTSVATTTKVDCAYMKPPDKTEFQPEKAPNYPCNCWPSHAAYSMPIVSSKISTNRGHR